MTSSPEDRPKIELGTAIGITVSIFAVAAGGFVAARRVLDARNKDTIEEGETDETI